MRNVEYGEINSRLDQPRGVLMAPQLFNITLETIAVYEDFAQDDRARQEKYPSADYGLVLEKFSDASFVRKSPRRVSGVYKVGLSMDEQNYILEMYEARILKEEDEALAEVLSAQMNRLKSRYTMANRHAVLPPGVLDFEQEGLRIKDKEED